jgi:DNA-binding response OmpR family regulator
MVPDKAADFGERKERWFGEPLRDIIAHNSRLGTWHFHPGLCWELVRQKEKSMSIRVLVVDDEMDTLSLLRTILQISGFEPITTLNSVDAINLADTEQPDVILLDIMMPRLDGFTLCKMMRQNPATKSLPIIFVTAYEALDIEERRVEAGADLVIHKPINIDRLINAIHEVQEMRSTAQSALGDRAVSKGTASPDGGSSTAQAERADWVERHPGPTDDVQ